MLADTCGASTLEPTARLSRSIDAGSKRNAFWLRGSRTSVAGEAAASSCSPVKNVSVRRVSSNGAGALMSSHDTGPRPARTEYVTPTGTAMQSSAPSVVEAPSIVTTSSPDSTYMLSSNECTTASTCPVGSSVQTYRPMCGEPSDLPTSCWREKPFDRSAYAAGSTFCVSSIRVTWYISGPSSRRRP